MYRCCIYLGQNTQKKAHLFTDVLFSLSKNAHQARAEMGVLVYKRVKNEKNAEKMEGWLSLHFLFANFLRFMAANLSLTQIETWARPR